MSVTVSMLPSEPILVAVITAPFVPEDDMPVMLRDIKTLREQVTQQVVIIIDMSAVNINFTTLADALAMARDQIRKEREAGATLPGRYLFVGSDDLVSIAADAMTQEQYGGIGGMLFASYDDALAHARALVRQGA